MIHRPTKSGKGLDACNKTLADLVRGTGAALFRNTTNNFHANLVSGQCSPKIIVDLKKHNENKCQNIANY